MNRPVAVFAANRGYALTSSRMSLIRHFLAKDWVVVLATADDEESRELCNMGAVLEPVRFNRGGLSPVADMAAFVRLRNIYRKWKPIMVQHFHAKPLIIGSLAAKQVPAHKVRIINTITGLGHAFVAGGILSRLAGIGYSTASSNADIMIFQNKDDMALFREKGWVEKGRSRLVRGSGVDIEQFKGKVRYRRDIHKPIVVMLGRLLRQKGILEFAEVARRVRHRWPEARFLWAGEEDSGHPDSVSAKRLRSQTGVEYLGRLSDVVPLLNKADILLFPSYYREGVPRVVLESSAMALPTVGFDVPGVREAVVHGRTGFLVKERDVDALTERVIFLLENESIRQQMGSAARNMVIRDFNIKSIQEQYLELYRDIGIRDL